MNSEHVSPPSNEPPEALSGTSTSRVLKVLTFVALILFLFPAAIGMLLVEGLSVATFGEINIDAAEMQQARALIESQEATLAAIKLETAAIEQRIAARRQELKREKFGKGATANVKPSLPAAPGNGGPGMPAIIPSNIRRAPDAVTLAFLSLERLNSSSLRELERLNESERDELAELIARALNDGALAPYNAILAIQRVGDEQEQAAVLRSAVKDLQFISYTDTDLLRMVDMCRCLPEPERAANLLVLLHSIGRFHGGIMPDTIATVPPSDVPKLASLLAHPMFEVQNAVHQRMSEEQLWATLLPALAGKDYSLFVVASGWIGQQPPRDAYRKAVLDGLRDVVWFRDGSEKSAFDIYAEWADQSEADNVLKLLAEPDSVVAEPAALIELGRRVGLPATQLIERSQGAAEAELFARYLQGDAQLDSALAEFLQGDGPTDKRLRWMTWISESGTAAHLKRLEAAAAHIQQSHPKTVLANQANQLLDAMKTRLSE